MTTPLLRTKLYIPPLRPGIVSRPRLIEELNAGLRELTLISAPADFSKTTLLSEWIHRKGRGTPPLPVAWFRWTKATTPWCFPPDRVQVGEGDAR